MAAKKATRRKTVKKTTTRTQIARRPTRSKTRSVRLAGWLARSIAKRATTRSATVQSRKDAAILRATHKGCTTCSGVGTIATHDKKGKLTGSKTCPAKPATMKVSRWQVAAASRFGADKASGLFGWRCPCGAKEKPRYRDAKLATAAIRRHEKAKHGGSSVGAAWYQQVPEGAPVPAAKTVAAPAVSKAATGPAMTDKQWEKQNKNISPAVRKAKGLCWQCTDGALYTAFGGVQKTVVCNECTGTGKAKTPATSTP